MSLRDEGYPIHRELRYVNEYLTGVHGPHSAKDLEKFRSAMASWFRYGLRGYSLSAKGSSYDREEAFDNDERMTYAVEFLHQVYLASEMLSNDMYDLHSLYFRLTGMDDRLVSSAWSTLIDYIDLFPGLDTLVGWMLETVPEEKRAYKLSSLKRPTLSNETLLAPCECGCADADAEDTEEVKNYKRPRDAEDDDESDQPSRKRIDA